MWGYIPAELDINSDFFTTAVDFPICYLLLPLILLEIKNCHSRTAEQNWSASGISLGVLMSCSKWQLDSSYY